MILTKPELMIEMAVKMLVDCGVIEHATVRLTSYYGTGVTFVIPSWVELEPGEWTWEVSRSPPTWYWLTCMIDAEKHYQWSVLPTETANLREWRHIFDLQMVETSRNTYRGRYSDDSSQDAGLPGG
jgi:hypothetical protein